MASWHFLHVSDKVVVASWITQFAWSTPSEGRCSQPEYTDGVRQNIADPPPYVHSDDSVPTPKGDRSLPSLHGSGAGAPTAKPIMQGCRESMPDLQQRNEYYRTDKHMLKMVKDGDVALLKGSWLLDCYKKGRVLPRRQDLESKEPEAFWSFHELTQRKKGCITCVSISHCWYRKQHDWTRDVWLAASSQTNFAENFIKLYRIGTVPILLW